MTTPSVPAGPCDSPLGPGGPCVLEASLLVAKDVLLLVAWSVASALIGGGCCYAGAYGAREGRASLGPAPRVRWRLLRLQNETVEHQVERGIRELEQYLTACARLRSRSEDRS